VVRQLPLVASCQPLARPTLSDREASELERLFKALADRHRVKILNLLQAAGEVCVCDFVPSLGLSQPTISYHLRQLSDAGLILRERRGSYAYYQLAPGALERVGGLIAAPWPAVA
jgi:ArsR family transcriptional regulator, arsenate/arsenite/antimonite-responsive transcriptional repressor